MVYTTDNFQPWYSSNNQQRYSTMRDYGKLAEQMRLIWPAGMKDNKWSWRDSVANLARRLQDLNAISNIEKYTDDQILQVCRQYVNQYEGKSTKYMMLLKYFIYKNKDEVAPNGKIRIVFDSKLADMLESSATIAENWDFDDTTVNYEDIGEII